MQNAAPAHYTATRPCRKCGDLTPSPPNGRAPYCAACKAHAEANRPEPPPRTGHMCRGGCGAVAKPEGSGRGMIYCPACREAAKRRKAAAARTLAEAEPQVVAAHAAVKAAVRCGALPHPSQMPCELAGKRGWFRECKGLHVYHHPDYSRPLFVVALCASHHSQVHTWFATRGTTNKCGVKGCDVREEAPRFWFCSKHTSYFLPVQYWPEVNQ